MKLALAISAVCVLALSGCNEAATPSGSTVAAATPVAAAATPKKAGQLCAMTAQQCQSFSKREEALLRVINMPPSERSAIDETSFQLIDSTLRDQQALADQNCTPATGSLKRKARLISKTGKTSLLMARGSSVCTLIIVN